MKAEELLSHLKAVRRAGGGWIAWCPAHEDRSPSLSVRQGDGGRILVHCFAGCSIESICAALGIGMRDLFAGPRVPGEPEPPIVRETEKRIAGLRSYLTRAERERQVTVVLATVDSLDAAIARALALTVEGDIVQAVFREGAE